MNRKTLVVVTAVLFIVASGCELLGDSPDRASRPDVPDSEIVPTTAIPRSFSDSVYFLYGAKLADGPVPVLQEVLDHDFRIQNAWYPEAAVCMRAFLPEALIVQLKAPDQRIYELGFISDSSELLVGCFATWQHYEFED